MNVRHEKPTCRDFVNSAWRLSLLWIEIPLKSLNKPVRRARAGNGARRSFCRLSDAELAGQVIMAGIDGTGFLSAAEEKRLGDIKPGFLLCCIARPRACAGCALKRKKSDYKAVL